MTSLCTDPCRTAPRRRRTVLHAFFHRLAGLPGLWVARIRARGEMQRLTDDALCDLGLRRRDVDAEGRKPFWRK